MGQLRENGKEYNLTEGYEYLCRRFQSGAKLSEQSFRNLENVFKTIKIEHDSIAKIVVYDDAKCETYDFGYIFDKRTQTLECFIR